MACFVCAGAGFGRAVGGGNLAFSDVVVLGCGCAFTAGRDKLPGAGFTGIVVTNSLAVLVVAVAVCALAWGAMGAVVVLF